MFVLLRKIAAVLRRSFKEEMQNYLNGLSEAKIVGDNIKEMLIDKSTEIANSLSTENMKLSPCKIYMLDIIGKTEKPINPSIGIRKTD